MYIYGYLICSDGPHTDNLPSVTNELAIPHSDEHKPKDEHKQDDKHKQKDQLEESWSPGGRRGSQKHFYTNPPRFSQASILDDDESLAGELDSTRRTPYLILSPIQVIYTYNTCLHTYSYGLICAI